MSFEQPQFKFKKDDKDIGEEDEVKYVLHSSYQYPIQIKMSEQDPVMSLIRTDDEYLYQLALRCRGVGSFLFKLDLNYLKKIRDDMQAERDLDL